jgi:hypothetical protein
MSTFFSLSLSLLSRFSHGYLPLFLFPIKPRAPPLLFSLTSTFAPESLSLSLSLSLARASFHRLLLFAKHAQSLAINVVHHGMPHSLLSRVDLNALTAASFSPSSAVFPLSQHCLFCSHLEWAHRKLSLPPPPSGTTTQHY